MASFVECSFVKDSQYSVSTVIRTDGHDLIDKRILHFVLFKVVQTEDGVKPLADSVLLVLVLEQFNAGALQGIAVL